MEFFRISPLDKSKQNINQAKHTSASEARGKQQLLESNNKQIWVTDKKSVLTRKRELTIQ